MRQKVRNQPEYVLNDGTHYLMDEYDEIMLGTTSIWLMIDIAEHIIHKHGPHEFVKKKYDEFQAKIRRAANEDGKSEEDRKFFRQMGNDMVMLDVTKIPIEELNHALAASGYIKTLLIKYKIIEK